MFLERRTSVKMDHSVFNMRINSDGVSSEYLEHGLKMSFGFTLRLAR